MRVISGSARGTKLKMVPGDSTRPIMDRVKENLFNIIGNRVYDSVWLDLFAGTGQVGIEALSRGAERVTFIDNTRPAIRTIHQNLKATRLEENGVVIQRDAFTYLKQQLDKNDPAFDVIYVAPPQYKGLWVDALKLIDSLPQALLRPDGQVIVQIDPKEVQELALNHLKLVDERRYGRTLLYFFAL
ncbi:MAG: 16S rRNA (guanine(966)-N(2))-methyltransferase RsmD [Ardenticatenaceae bacterium]|nr:16S rRNA (guanine(966)-N(2))-methyltransferase RsmD [Ardenticatenaceae bacterium]